MRGLPEIRLGSPEALTWSRELSPRARDLLEVFHERHVPLTPRLAEALAGMEASPDPASAPIWGRAWTLAGISLGLQQHFGRTRRWASFLDVFGTVVAEPLLRRASERSGVVPLALISDAGRPGPAKLAADVRRIDEEVAALLGDPEAVGPGFWPYAGVALYAAFRQRVGSTRPEARQAMPAKPLSLLSYLVFEVEPILPEDRVWTRRTIKSTARAQRYRTGLRPREGGVRGIVHTRRMEDIGSALASSFAYPEAYVVARLLDEGFFVPHRPPMRRPSRDLLSLVFNETPLWDGPAAVVKAAWIDATVRLGLLLTDFGMPKSEVAWSDLHQTGPASAAVSMEHLPHKVHGARAARSLSGKIRHGMISRSPLMPSAFSALPQTQWSALDDPVANRRAAILHALASCARAAAVTGPAGSRSGKVQPLAPSATTEPGDYAVAFVLALQARPSDGSKRRVEWSKDRKSVRSDYDIGRVRALFSGEIVLPDSVEPGAVYQLASDFDPEGSEIVFSEETSEDTALGGLVGALSDWLMDQTIRAIHAA